MNIPLSIYDEIIRDKTALWAIYEKGGLEPVFFKIVSIVPPNGILSCLRTALELAWITMN